MAKSSPLVPEDPMEFTQFSFTPEEALEPELEIVDPHHHVRDPVGRPRYLFQELLADLTSGHNIIATVAIEVGDMFRADAPPDLRPVGETEFLNGIAAMFASGKYGKTLGCAGIVSFADLRLGDKVQRVLDAHIAAGGGRFRGIRMPGAYQESYAPARMKNRQAATGMVVPPHLLLDPGFRAGFACLGPRNLSFDVMVFHPQIPDLMNLARAFPGTSIISNHYGVPLGLGPFAGKYKEVFVPWRAAVQKLAQCPNVFVKLGGLRKAGIAIPGYTVGEFGQYEVQPSSAELAQAWRPYTETCIEAFGPDRCMFESNFPPEKVVCNYACIWNAFKRATTGYSATERAALFSGTAAHAYRLSLPKAAVS